MSLQAYQEFLRAKIAMAANHGFEIGLDEISPILKPHQKLIVQWAVRGGRRAIFASFGLGKSVMQLEILRIIVERCGGRGLIIAPLGVRHEFQHDSAMIGTSLRFIRRIEEADADGLYITNYETVREGKLDPRLFTAVSLDEAACLRGFGSTLTFREFMARIAGDDRSAGIKTEGIRYRFVATATPSPNQFIELLAYAAFLGVMDIGQGKTRFFKRNSEKADELTIHPHKQHEFWLWCSSWGLFLTKPSELGFSDEGYELPALTAQWHEIPTDHSGAGEERDGQARMFRNAAIGVQDAAREKRSTLDERVAKIMALLRAALASEPNQQLVIWCDLNDEQHAIEGALNADGITVSSLYGNQDVDHREGLLGDWKERRTTVFLSKPMMYGAGVNLQQSHTMIFAGVGFKFYAFVQAIHRIQRFLQAHACTVHIIYSEAEREIRRTLEAKWARHEELVAQMTAIIREYGLSEAAMASTLQRTIGCTRCEAKGQGWTLVNNDAIEETMTMAANSVDLVLTSVPFSTQYEYTPSYNDLGHTDSNEHFWRQMDFLTPELLRTLKPGRVAAIHVKDRIVPGGLTGLGFQTLYPFSDDCIAHFQKHGFAFLARKTIVTDVVRENNQTYRLGWTEQCKDGSRMGCGVPEYLLLFRKPPTDSSNGYADDPVLKPKLWLLEDGSSINLSHLEDAKKIKSASDRKHEPPPGPGYSRARWQVDAHGFMRSSGNRLLDPAELVGLDADVIFKIFRRHTLTQVYDFESHVACGEALEAAKQLPKKFMLLQPASWHPDVWTDVTRMRTLNGAQSAAGREMHLCCLQFDICDRVIAQFSMPGDLVFDPFVGLGTVALRALKLGRRGLGVELSPKYFPDAVAYLQAEEERLATPSLFDLLEATPGEQLEAAE